jgi:hypothetical protein
MSRLKESGQRLWRTLRAIATDVEAIESSVARAVHGLPRSQAPEGPTVPVDPSVRFEHSDINAFGVVITGVSVLVFSAIFTGLIYFYFTALAHHRSVISPPPLAIEAHGNPMPPEPRIQESPRRDLEDQRVYEHAVLNKYWWVDRQKGVVGLPIEQAMRILVNRGIPPQSAPADLKLFPPHTGDRAVGFENKVAPEPR